MPQNNYAVAAAADLERIPAPQGDDGIGQLPVWIFCGAVPTAVTLSAPLSTPTARIPPTSRVPAGAPFNVNVSPVVIALALTNVLAFVPVATLRRCGAGRHAQCAAERRCDELPARLLTVSGVGAGKRQRMPAPAPSRPPSRRRPPALSVIDMFPEPVATVCAAVPVAVTVSAPLSPVATKTPLRPVTVDRAASGERQRTARQPAPRR